MSLPSFDCGLARLIDDASSAFVLFRQPGSHEVSMWLGHECEATTADLSELCDSAFHLAPFDSSEQPYLLLKPSIQLSGWSDICKHLYTSAPDQQISASFVSGTQEREATIQCGYENYAETFVQVMDIIEKGDAQKIVLARQVRIPCTAQAVVTYFLRALDLYPNTFVYLYSGPSVGCYAGATPELLVRIQDDRVQTVAIAGTMPVSEGCQLDSWSHKNVAEHLLVADYIEQILRPYCVTIRRGKISPISVGSLSHLHTPFDALLLPELSIQGIEQKQRSVTKATIIAQSLHPTPATCGLPTHIAKAMIARVESSNRDYYTGYLGIVSPDQATLFVNLRCLRYRHREATLYAGGGLMPTSICEEEWQETVAKLRATASLL